MDKTQHRADATRRLGELKDVLRRGGDAARNAALLEVADHLERAIASFHLEAIRFRMYTMGRLLSDPTLSGAEEARALFNHIRVDLEAAGFQTRSIAH